jgi:hypothetical protein
MWNLSGHGKKMDGKDAEEENHRKGGRGGIGDNRREKGRGDERRERRKNERAVAKRARVGFEFNLNIKTSLLKEEEDSDEDDRRPIVELTEYDKLSSSSILY